MTTRIWPANPPIQLQAESCIKPAVSTLRSSLMSQDLSECRVTKAEAEAAKAAQDLDKARHEAVTAAVKAESLQKVSCLMLPPVLRARPHCARVVITWQVRHSNSTRSCPRPHRQSPEYILL